MVLWRCSARRYLLHYDPTLMHANVHITVFEGDKIVDQRSGHNVWVEGGRTYLANLVTFDSPVVSTIEGSVDLVGAFPTISDEWLIVRIGYHTGMIEYRVTFSSPPDVATLLAQIDSQTSGITRVSVVATALCLLVMCLLVWRSWQVLRCHSSESFLSLLLRLDTPQRRSRIAESSTWGLALEATGRLSLVR